MDGISIRLLAPGDEAVVRELATYDGPGKGPANALYRGVGGATQGVTVQWELSYEDD